VGSGAEEKERLNSNYEKRFAKRRLLGSGEADAGLVIGQVTN
jgi:hypothetical protein